MPKEKEVTLEIRQAETTDATLLVDFLNQVGKESDYMTLDEAGIGMSPTDMACYKRQRITGFVSYYL